MIINPHIEPRIVEVYEFLLRDGIPYPITLDKESGDTIDWDSEDMSVTFHITAKPSPMDPEQKYPPKDITVFLSQVLVLNRYEQLITPATVEQRDIFKQTLHKMGSTVQ
jgi:hypothetical protein